MNKITKNELHPSLISDLDKIGILNKKTNRWVDVSQFESYATNGDWALAFKAAHDALPSEGGIITFSGSYTIKSNITFTKKIILQGSGHAQNKGITDRASAVLIKDGNFVGITVSGHGSVLKDFQLDGATGNQNDGIQILASRVTLKHIAVTNQGGNGIRIGGNSGENCNVWRMIDIITIGNGQNGVYIHDNTPGSGSLPNTNAGVLLGLDSRENMGDGLKIGASIDNSFYGVTCQMNSGIGVHLTNYANGNQFYGTYTEANTGGDFILDTGANKNIVFGYRSGQVGDSIVDNGSLNFVLGRDSQSGSLPYIKTSLAMKELVVQDPAISGYWKFNKDNTNRNLLVQLTGTSANANVKFTHAGGGVVTTQHDQIQIGTGTVIKKHIRQGATLDFGTIPANSAVERNITVTGASMSDAVYAYPTTAAPESGLVWSAYVSGTDTVTIRLANFTTNPVATTPKGWAVDVWKH